MSHWSDCIIPAVICIILIAGIVKKVPVFDVFLEGAREGFQTSISILPALVGLMTCVGCFKASGALDVLTSFLAPLTERVGLPGEVVPLALLRPISGSGALVIFEDILRQYGPDSLIGRVASVLQGSTETTFYTIAVYFSAAGITKTRHTVPCALTADMVGFLMSAAAVLWWFY